MENRVEKVFIFSENSVTIQKVFNILKLAYMFLMQNMISYLSFWFQTNTI